MSEPRTVVVNVPLNRGSDAEAIDVSLGFGGYGVQLRYISIRGRPKLTAMVTPDRARMLARALVHAADASDQKARGSDPRSPFADLEDENADLRMTLAAASAELGRLRHAIEDFILWWDMPPFALDDDERLRAEVDALREAIK